MDDVYMCSKSETAQLSTKPCIHVFIHDGKNDVDLGLPSAIADISHHHSGGILFSKQCFFMWNAKLLQILATMYAFSLLLPPPPTSIYSHVWRVDESLEPFLFFLVVVIF